MGLDRDRGDRFDLDDTDFVTLEFTAVKPAVAFKLTDDMHPDAEMLPYGQTVTFVFQLVDEADDPVAEEDVEIDVRTVEEDDDGVIRRRTHYLSTDSSGQVRLRYPVYDRSSRADDTDTYLDLEVTDSSEVDGRTGEDAVDDQSTVMILGENRLAWSDDKKEPTTLLLEQLIRYSSATSGRQTVIATLVDQYGEPVRGKDIHFFSDRMAGVYEDPNDSTMAKSIYRKTSERARIRYRWDGGQPDTETIWAVARLDPDPDLESKEPDLIHYWVEEAPDDRHLNKYKVLVHDEDRDTLVIELGGDGPYVVAYDTNDLFYVDGVPEKYEILRGEPRREEVRDRGDIWQQRQRQKRLQALLLDDELRDP